MKNLPKGRTYSEFWPLQPGEVKLLDAYLKGDFCELGPKRPVKKSKNNTVRASFIRFLALGGDNEVAAHELGIRVTGAWIEGSLKLSNACISADLSLLRSHFEEVPELIGTNLQGSLNLSGSLLPGLIADRAAIKGNVSLSHGFTSNGEIRLLGAKIGSDLDCTDAKLNVEFGDALSADCSVVQGNVFLSNGFTVTGQIRLLSAQIGGSLSCKGAQLNVIEGNALSADRATINGDLSLSDGFRSNGEIRLLAVQIGSNLDCTDAKLSVRQGDALSADRMIVKGSVFLANGFTSTGEIRLIGAQIGGNLDCRGAQLDSSEKGGDAFSAHGMRVEGTFFFCEVLKPVEGVSLESAHVGRLVDDACSWGARLSLDGFLYGHLGGGAPTDAKTRLTWLKKQHLTAAGVGIFLPQPWKQLQTVLRNMGHVEDARQVAIAFQDQLRSKNLIGQTPEEWSAWRRMGYRCAAKGLHTSFSALMSYGYRPVRLGLWMVAVWLFCAVVYWQAALRGEMAPSNPIVFQNLAAYKSCKNSPLKPDVEDRTNWYLCDDLPAEYTGFSPLAYSLDLLLPLVNLQQESDWAPLIPTPKGLWYQELFLHWTFKHVVRLVVWFEILFGWLASLLLVAVVSGLTKRGDE